MSIEITAVEKGNTKLEVKVSYRFKFGKSQEVGELSVSALSTDEEVIEKVKKHAREKLMGSVCDSFVEGKKKLVGKKFDIFALRQKN